MCVCVGDILTLTYILLFLFIRKFPETQESVVCMFMCIFFCFFPAVNVQEDKKVCLCWRQHDSDTWEITMRDISSSNKWTNQKPKNYGTLWIKQWETCYTVQTPWCHSSASFHLISFRNTTMIYVYVGICSYLGHLWLIYSFASFHPWISRSMKRCVFIVVSYWCNYFVKIEFLGVQ